MNVLFITENDFDKSCEEFISFLNEKLQPNITSIDVNIPVRDNVAYNILNYFRWLGNMMHLSSTIIHNKHPAIKLTNLSIRRKSMCSGINVNLSALLRHNQFIRYIHMKNIPAYLDNDLNNVADNHFGILNIEIDLPNTPSIESVCKRNRSILNNVKRSVMYFLWIRKNISNINEHNSIFFKIPKEIVLKIAKYIWETRFSKVWMISGRLIKL